MKDLKHIWSLACRETVINQDDNILSIQGILEEIAIDIPSSPDTNTIPEKINLPITYEIVSFWYKKDLKKNFKGQVRFILSNEKGIELFNTTQSLEIPAENLRFRSRMKIQGMTIQGAGEYSISVSGKEDKDKEYELLAEIPLTIKINS